MQRNESTFIVTRARLSVNERVLNVTYREASDDRPLTTALQASGFEHYLKCLHDVECPSLVEWMLRVSGEEMHARIAAYMECMMWSAYEEAAMRSDHRDEEPGDVRIGVRSIGSMQSNNCNKGPTGKSIVLPLPFYHSFFRA